MNRKIHLDRRTFMKALGATSAASLCPLLRSSRALAQPVAIPRRIVVFYAGDGLLAGSWQPGGVGGAAAPSERAFALGDILAPLADYQDDMILFENLDMVSNHHDPTPPANAHFEGSTHALTAAPRLNGTMPGGPSIDQLIASRINAPMPVTQLPSLEILCSANGRADAAFTSGPGQLVPFLQRPRDIYERLFPNPEDAAGDDAAVEQHNRVFAFVRGEMTPLLRRLTGDDREKLEQHMQTVEDLSRRLDLTSVATAAPPEPGILTPADGLSWSTNAPRDTASVERWHVAAEINMKLAAAALHTDTTRVVTVDLENPPGAAFGYRNGMFNANDPHDLTHKVHAQGTAQSQNPDARRAIFDEGSLKIAKLKLLLDELATRREADGQRLLDHTVVVFTSQIANGSHAHDQLPWFTVGSAGGYFRTGRFLQQERTTDPQRGWLSHGRPHNDLFVSLANAMGVDITSFGDPQVCRGPIQEMR